MRALFVCHEPNEGPARVGDELEAHGYRVRRFDVGTAPFPEPKALDLIAVMGAPYSVYDRNPTLQTVAEVAWIRQAYERGIPLLGICYGGQAIAEALGGRVERAPRPEIGWHEVESDVGWLATGPWFQWHGDRFWPPATATEVARSDVGSQAYVGSRVLGVQFHPEVDADLVADWLDGRHADEPEFAAALAVPDEIIARAEEATRAAAPALRALIDHFVEHIA